MSKNKQHQVQQETELTQQTAALVQEDTPARGETSVIAILDESGFQQQSEQSSATDGTGATEDGGDRSADTSQSEGGAETEGAEKSAEDGDDAGPPPTPEGEADGSEESTQDEGLADPPASEGAQTLSEPAGGLSGIRGLNTQAMSAGATAAPLDEPGEPAREVTSANYPKAMPGDFFRQYDKLSAVGKMLINVIYEHMDVASPTRALSDADGARRQCNLYHSLVGVMNLPRPEFDAALGLVLGTFLRYTDGAFSPALRLRWMQFISLSKNERVLFSVLMTMLPELADGRTRKTVFKQFEKRFEKTLIESSGSTRLTKQAAANVLAYFRK